MAIVHRVYAELIVRGEKRVECRLTRNRVPPFGCVSVGERVYVKVSSGPVVATGVVSWVEQVEGLTPTLVRRLRGRVGPMVCAPEEFWEARQGCRYCTLVGLDGVEAVSFGPDYRDLVRPGSRAAWHVMPGDRDVYPACVGGAVVGSLWTETGRAGI